MSDLSGKKVELTNGATAWEPCHIESESIGIGTNIERSDVYKRQVEIGVDCRIQGTVYIADGCKISDNVFIGPGAVLTNDRYPPSQGRWNPVVVEDDVVIGANATIVAGVRLHTGCVIAAGSVVTTDIPSQQVWAGNPAKFLMTREDYEKRRDENE